MFDRLNTKEKRLQARQFYIPAGATERTYPEADAVVYCYQSGNLLAALAFVGTAGKPAWHYTFRTAERMEKYIAEFIESQRRTHQYKAEQKKKNKGVLTGAAACAAAIRKELKEKFPGVRFSVRSQTFAGGDSVDIDWTDGPTYEEVEAIVKDYQEGYFDGMTDSYEYKKDRDPNKPGAKYVSANKHFSESEIQRIHDRAEELGILSRCVNDWDEFRPILAEKAIREELQRREEQKQKPEPKPERQKVGNIIMVDFISKQKIS
jgi:hypothetical protein